MDPLKESPAFPEVRDSLSLLVAPKKQVALKLSQKEMNSANSLRAPSLVKPPAENAARWL